MDVKTKFIHSKPFHPKFGDIIFGKYKITTLPTGRDGMLSALWESLLMFEDSLRKDERSSQPTVESDYILYWLSLIFKMRIEPKGILLNNVEIGYTKKYREYYKEYEAQITELPDLESIVRKLCSLDIDTLRQYLRACEVYNFALTLFGENNTLAFFLLSVSIECIANKVIPSGKTRDKFTQFILNNISEEKARECKDENEWNEFLKEIYYNHRSGFTHGGKEIPEASFLADRLNRNYVKNEIDGKEVKTPSLKWFESVVSSALIGFLNKQPINSSMSFEKIKDLSLEKGFVKIKVKKPLEAGVVVKADDVELD